jgi:hypothetical protein
MPDEFRLVVSRGYVQLRRRWVMDPERPWHKRGGRVLRASWRDQPGIEVAEPVGRGDRGQSPRSRNNMRRLFASLPWEVLGPRPAMISLTYPGEWQRWVPDGRVWDGHRRALERRWVRRWGEPLVGVWAKEFQGSGRPHLHLYVGLPSAMSADDYLGLRRRTLLRHRLEWHHGKYEGRRRLPAIGGRYGGEFAMWLRTAWSEVVGTQGVVQHHHARGADVAVFFWSDEVAETADRTRVAGYLAAEASKWRQKQPPEGFAGVGHYFGRWGRRAGFNPVVEEIVIDRAVAWEAERRLARWVRLKLRSQRGRRSVDATAFAERREGDGVTALGLGPAEAMRVLRWAEAAAARKAASRKAATAAGTRGRSPGRPPCLSRGR